MVEAGSITILLATCLILFEWFLPRTRLLPAWQRKFMHVSICLVVTGFANLLPYGWFAPIGIFFTGVLILLRVFRPLTSLSDRHDSSFGEIFLPLGVAAAALLARSSTTFQITVLVLGLADTTAYIVGRSFSSPRLVFDKTIAGGGAYILSAVVIISITRTLPVALVIGALLGLVELFSPKGSDNLTTPLAAALLLGVV